MKIAVSTKGKNLTDQVDQRFGRCQYFLIFDTDTKTAVDLSNPGGGTSGGAGIQASQALVKEKIDCALVGNIGPNAMAVLSAAGIQVFSGINGTVDESLEAYRQGKLKQLNEANVSSHAGMSGRR